MSLLQLVCLPFPKPSTANMTSLLSAVCSICIASSLGEIASIYPTAGGQYSHLGATFLAQD